MLGGIGWTEVLIVLAIVLLLFGGSKLPDLARGSGRALRIFKSEVKALDNDDKDQDGQQDSAQIEALGDQANSGRAAPTRKVQSSNPTTADANRLDDAEAQARRTDLG